MQGVRTLVLTNATGAVLAREQAEGRRFNERWVHVPDVEGFAVTNKSGDYRAALAPLLARDLYGPSSFKCGLVSLPPAQLPAASGHGTPALSVWRRERWRAAALLAHGPRRCAPAIPCFHGRPPLLLLPQVAAVWR